MHLTVFQIVTPAEF